MTNRANIDPDDAAMAAEERPACIFGQVEKKAYFAVLVKGTGKVLFDPAVHKAEHRVTAIEFIIYPMPGARYSRPIPRGMIAESSEWTKTVLPSLRTLKIDLRSLDGRYVKVKLVPIGTYTNKASEEKTRTTLQFLEIYADDSACQRAQDEYLGVETDDILDAPTPPAPPPMAPVPAPTSSRERQIAERFLPALWKGAGGNVEQFAAALGGNALTSRYFTLNSPEVIALIQQAKG